MSEACRAGTDTQLCNDVYSVNGVLPHPIANSRMLIIPVLVLKRVETQKQNYDNKLRGVPK